MHKCTQYRANLNKKKKKLAKESAKVGSNIVAAVHPNAVPSLTLGVRSSKESGYNINWQQFTPGKSATNSIARTLYLGLE